MVSDLKMANFFFFIASFTYNLPWGFFSFGMYIWMLVTTTDSFPIFLYIFITSESHHWPFLLSSLCVGWREQTYICMVSFFIIIIIFIYSLLFNFVILLFIFLTLAMYCCCYLVVSLFGLHNLEIRGSEVISVFLLSQDDVVKQFGIIPQMDKVWLSIQNETTKFIQ